MIHRLGFFGEKENFLKHFHFLSIEVFTHILLHYFFIFSFLCNQKLSIILFFFCESSDLYPPRCCDFHHPLDIIYTAMCTVLESMKKICNFLHLLQKIQIQGVVKNFFVWMCSEAVRRTHLDFLSLRAL